MVKCNLQEAGTFVFSCVFASNVGFIIYIGANHGYDQPGA